MMSAVQDNVIQITNKVSDFEIVWNNLSYTVTKTSFFGAPVSSRQILKEVSGRAKSRELVALMGPSGAGKSTLLECVIGKRTEGRSGELVFRGDGDLARVKMAFIPQHDCFLTSLTVRECITFASKLQNSTRELGGTLDDIEDSNGKVFTKLDAKYHQVLVDDIIKRLGLQVCEDNRVSRCSGGQQKRLSIAQELVARPSILILDEPTSGLDSASCLQVVDLLNKLTRGEEPVAVIATIHQPSIKVFNLFDKVYLISRNGHCLYEGAPNKIPSHFQSLGLEIPKHYNMADFAIEVASGQYGDDALDRLRETHDGDFLEDYNQLLLSAVATTPMSILRATTQQFPFLTHTLVHAQRSFLMTLRDPIVFVMRFALSFLVAALVGRMFGPVGKRGGCPPALDGDFEPSDLDGAVEHIKSELTDTYNNVGVLFVMLLFMLFNALMPTCMVFPGEMLVFVKEHANGWYGVPAYYAGKVLAEIPFQVALPPIFVSIIWIMTEQVSDFWRCLNCTGIMIVVTFVGQSLGYIIGALYMNNLPASVYLGPMSCIPFMLFSGIFTKITSLPGYLKLLTYTSYIRFGSEGMIITLYGFNRCGKGSSQKLLDAKEALIVWLGAMLGTFNEDTTPLSIYGNETAMSTEGKPTIAFVENLVDNLAGKFISKRGTVQSSILNSLEIYDEDIWRSWVCLIMLLLIKRIIAYYVIASRTR